MKSLIKIHKKSLIYIICSLSVSGGLLLIARHVSGFGEFYASKVFPVFSNTLGRLFSPIPFSVFEICIYLLIFAVIGFILYALSLLMRKNSRKKLKTMLPSSILRFLCFCTTLLLMLTLTCSINYNRAGFATDANLITTPSSSEALAVLCNVLIDDLTALEDEISVDESGDFSLQASFDTGNEKEALSKTADAAKEAMQFLGQTYPTLSGYYPNPKQVLLSSKMSNLNLTGIFSPYTIEANYNGDVCDYVIPYTICHELAHLKGYISEDEAGFIAYLACSQSATPQLRYSAAVNALSYSLNALYRHTTEEEYQAVLSRVPQQAIHDLQSNQAYWRAHASALSQVARSANDQYLKANAQADGVHSYGRMVDLMLSYYNIDATSL